MKILFVMLLALFSSFQAFAEQEQVIVLKPNSFVRFTEEFNQFTVAKFIQDFLAQTSDNIVIYLDSPGGDVLAGLRMIETVRGAKAANPNLKVTCVVGSAASMAFYFLQLACDERLVSETTILMQHQGSFGLRGKAGEVENIFRHYKSIGEWLDNQSAKRLKMPVKKLQEKITNDWWMMGFEAVKENVADKVISVTCSPDLLKMPPSEDTKKSACPLVFLPVPSGDTARKSEKTTQK